MNKSIIFILIFALFLSAIAYSLEKTNIESPSHPNSDTWTNMAQATFKWQDITDAIGYSYVIDSEANTEPDSEIELTDNSLTKGVNSGIFYFHLKTIGNGETSQTSHYMFKIDSENPAIPAKVKVESKEGYLLVSWEQEPDILSGISYYNLYRSNLFNFDIRDVGVTKITQTKDKQPITTPYYEDYDIQENKSYFYKIRVYDNAGNARLTFAAKGTRTLGECSAIPTLDLSIENKTLTMVVTTQATLYDYKIELEQNGKKETALFLSKVPSESTNTFDISKYKDGEVKVIITSLDKEKDSCAEEISFIIDTQGPEIEILSPEKESTLVEKKPIYITAIDSRSEIKSVKYYTRKGADDKYIAQFTKNDSNYSSSLSPDTLGAGQQLIVIIAEDEKGNKTEKTFSFNSNPLNDLEKEIKTNIDEMEILAKEIQEKTNEYLQYSSEFTTILQEIIEIDSLKQKLQERTLTQEDLQTATNLKENLTTLKDSFKQITTKQIKIEVQRDIKEALREQGVKEEYSSISLLTDEKITKIIEFKKYEAGNISKEMTTIYYEIPFAPTEGTDNFLIIEFLPKGIDIQNIKASLDFTIIDSDPIIAFDLPKDKISGNKIIFSYTLTATDYAKTNPAGVFGGVPLLIQKPELMPEKEALYQSNDLFFYIGILAVFVVLIFIGTRFIKFPHLPKLNLQKKPKGKFSSPKK